MTHTPVGILVRTPSPHRKSSPQQQRRVHFQERPPNLKDILRDSSGADRQRDLDLFISDLYCQQGQVLIDWLRQLQECAALLTPNENERFVIQVMLMPWLEQEKPIFKAFLHFVTTLISAHNFYLKIVFAYLFRTGFPQRMTFRGDDLRLTTDLGAAQAHESVIAILALSPVSAKQMLLKYAKECLPYVLKDDDELHANYIRNLCKVLDYVDEDARDKIWHILIDRLVQMDALVPRLSDDFESDDEEEDQVFEMDKPVTINKSAIARKNLDKVMEVMFQFIDQRFEDRERLFRELLTVFETHILPTYAVAHVQFLTFFMLSRDPSLTAKFIEFLWHKFLNPNTPAILRQSCVGYIGSLLARGRFVTLDTVTVCLDKLVKWLHSYIQLHSKKRSDVMFVDLKAHGAFYAAAQAVFYLFAFRHKELVHQKLDFLKSLNLTSLVSSHLNPLRVCLPPVVKNFSSIARHYQIVYCQAIIERNNRMNLPVVGQLSSAYDGKPLLLDSFFPFDPYNLTNSVKYVEDSYRLYEGSKEIVEEDEEDEDEEMEVDDIVSPKENSVGSAKINSFLYGASPGFKY